MNRTLIAVTLLCLLTPLQTVMAEALVLRGGTLIAMDGTPPQSDAAMLIVDGRIEQIWTGNTAPVPLPEDVRYLDADGGYILPGFIDSHVHYNWYMGELFLAHGITTVNDLSSRAPWQQAVRNGLNSGQLRGPGYLYCERVDAKSVATPANAVATVAQIREQADCIRIDLATPEPIYTAVTAAAEEAGLAVIAHSYNALLSAMMGVDGIEHLEGVALATIRSSAGQRAVEYMTLEEGHKHPLLYQWMEEAHYDDVIDTLISRGVYLNPTLLHEWKGVIDRSAAFEREDLRLFHDPDLQYIPEDEKRVVLGQYHWADAALVQTGDIDIDQQVFVNNSYFIPAAGLADGLARGYANIQAFLRRFVAAGGKLYAGTDTAAASTPGLSLHQEMQLLADAGIPNEAVLAAVTRDAAELLQVDDRIGTLATGKVADIVILDANPLEDIANTRHIRQVIRHGEPIDIRYHADYESPFRQYGPVSKHLYHRRPVITAVSPDIAASESITTLRISGRHFMPETIVVFNGETLPTEHLSTTELSAVLGPRHTVRPGSYLVTVRTPAPGGGEAEGVEFIVDFVRR